MNCQARGCGVDKDGIRVWCRRHRRVLLNKDRAALRASEEQVRGTKEWTETVRRCQQLITNADPEAQRQQEMFDGDS